MQILKGHNIEGPNSSLVSHRKPWKEFISWRREIGFIKLPSKLLGYLCCCVGTSRENLPLDSEPQLTLSEHRNP